MEANIELLAPAGSAQSLKAAVNAGADAVYMGTTRFSARALADNPAEEAFFEAMDYAHLHGRRVYLTVNTLLKQDEAKELYSFLKPFYERGIDAVIVQDYGALLLIREWFPNLPIHASTQMSVTGKRFASELKKMGVSRVILARELSFSEIRDIADSVDIELECFIHGALCYCYSGQCLLSSLIGGRSGNRGRCAQPCRLSYSTGPDSEGCLLSLKDLDTIDILPDILDAGVTSLKIEGRMKSPVYTAGVVNIYRKYLDLLMAEGREGYKVSPEDHYLLRELFDRGGSTQGYFSRHNGKDMIAIKEKPAFRKTDQKYFTSVEKEYVESELKIPLSGRITIHEGEAASLTVSDPADARNEVTVYGPVVQAAINSPLNREDVSLRINETGNTLYSFEDITCDLTGSCFLPVKELRELRRQAIKTFEGVCLDKYKRTAIPRKEKATADLKPRKVSGTKEDLPDMRIHVSIEDIDCLPAALSCPGVEEICLDSSFTDASLWKDSVKSCHGEGKKCALMLPAIFRTDAEEYFDRNIRILKEAGFDELIVRSLEEPGFLGENGIDLPLVFDSGIYVWNRAAEEALKNMGASRLTLPTELNSRELERLGCEGKELVVYGYLPVMISAQCLKKTTKKCDKKSGLIFLKDRTGRSFPVKNSCRFCCNTIYNSVPFTLLGKEDTVRRLAPSVLRLSFTIESPSQTALIINACEDAFLEGKTVSIPFKDYTRAHFNRGVE